MQQLYILLVCLIAFEHLWFLVLEMFLWQKPLGIKIFRTDPEFAKQSAPLAANQGLYNGFLSAGLICSVIVDDATTAAYGQCYFLICVLVAGLFGGWTVNKKIYFMQALPASVALSIKFFT